MIIEQDELVLLIQSHLRHKFGISNAQIFFEFEPELKAIVK